MTVRSSTRVPTANGRRYLQQMCRHWSHNIAVEFTEEQGKVVFPRNTRGADWPGDATLLLFAHTDALECRLETSSEGQLETLKKGVALHVDRFGFREAPFAFEWHDA